MVLQATRPSRQFSMLLSSPKTGPFYSNSGDRRQLSRLFCHFNHATKRTLTTLARPPGVRLGLVENLLFLASSRAYCTASATDLTLVKELSGHRNSETPLPLPKHGSVASYSFSPAKTELTNNIHIVGVCHASYHLLTGFVEMTPAQFFRPAKRIEKDAKC